MGDMQGLDMQSLWSHRLYFQLPHLKTTSGLSTREMVLLVGTTATGSL